MTNTTSALARWYREGRLGGLRRFAIAITVLNGLGHTWFGFEQPWAAPFVGLAAAYSTELLIELVDALVNRRALRFSGGMGKMADFLLSAHISGLACSMLIYPNARLWPVAFAASAAIASKHLLRVRINGGTRHFFNPSNLGITATLLLFPWVGISPPYHFTENIIGVGDFVLPGIILFTGSFLNYKFTKRLPLLFAWVGGFAAQAVVRNLLFGTSILAGLAPVTGVAFILYTFYMITDPATTPEEPKCQVAFGLAAAFAYALLMVFHVVFGLFFSLTAVCLIRGLSLYVYGFRPVQHMTRALVGAPAVTGGDQ